MNPSILPSPRLQMQNSMRSRKSPPDELKIAETGRQTDSPTARLLRMNPQNRFGKKRNRSARPPVTQTVTIPLEA